MVDLGGSGGDGAGVNCAGGTVNRDIVTFLEDGFADGEGLGAVVDDNLGGATNADLIHLTCDEGSVGGDPTTGGEDTFSCDHTAQVFGSGFNAAEDSMAPFGGDSFGSVCGEADFTGGGTRAGGESAGEGFYFFLGGSVKDGDEEGRDGIGGDLLERGFFDR